METEARLAELNNQARIRAGSAAARKRSNLVTADGQAVTQLEYVAAQERKAPGAAASLAPALAASQIAMDTVPDAIQQQAAQALSAKSTMLSAAGAGGVASLAAQRQQQQLSAPAPSILTSSAASLPPNATPQLSEWKFGGGGGGGGG